MTTEICKVERLYIIRFVFSFAVMLICLAVYLLLCVLICHSWIVMKWICYIYDCVITYLTPLKVKSLLLVAMFILFFRLVNEKENIWKEFDYSFGAEPRSNNQIPELIGSYYPTKFS